MSAEFGDSRPDARTEQEQLNEESQANLRCFIQLLAEIEVEACEQTALEAQEEHRFLMIAYAS